MQDHVEYYYDSDVDLLIKKVDDFFCVYVHVENTHAFHNRAYDVLNDFRRIDNHYDHLNVELTFASYRETGTVFGFDTMFMKTSTSETINIAYNFVLWLNRYRNEPLLNDVEL
jgi:hypothetical protein